MRTIKFNALTYELKDNENVSASHFQSTILKGDNTLDTIYDDVKGTTTITVFEDDNVVAIYEGYTTVLALVITSNDIVSIEMVNTDIEAQISNLTQTQQVMDEAITDIAETVNTITETNTVQDEAIEDLAEAVDELSQGGE